jgi:histidinol phosphatase-like PHP family hydrolase
MDPVAAKYIGAGIACIGMGCAGVGVGAIFGHYLAAALRNPSVQILGHPRGRIYNYRLGLTANWTRVFDLAASLDKAVEIDCYPDRQDLSHDLLLLARKAGCRISLGTDAHGPSQLAFIEFGLASAGQAGIPCDRILNFMTAQELLEWVGDVRHTPSISAKRSGISINDTV